MRLAIKINNWDITKNKSKRGMKTIRSLSFSLEDVKPVQTI
jgi:hypothetical protein